ncbi:MAG: glycosyltransferase family 4 protein [Chloroflexi bacterium]|nr:glycosyltransferase family 4 protein [Chloroflexota bacterium]
MRIEPWYHLLIQMKLLIVSPQPIFPPNDGGRARVYHLAKALSELHEVHVACPPGEGEPRVPFTTHPLPSGGIRRQIGNPNLVPHLRRLILEIGPDVVQVEQIWQVPWAAIAAARTGATLVLDATNVEHQRFRGMGARVWPLIRLWEIAAVRLAGTVFAVSDEDLAALRKLGTNRNKFHLVPNGYDGTTFHPNDAARLALRDRLAVEDDEPLLLFFGLLSYPPNSEALEILRQEIVPKLDASELRFRLIVAGKDPPDELLEDERLQYVGMVDDIAAHINAADAVLVPLRSGGGTRLKILETIACGTPVVSTTIGAAGLDVAVCSPLLTLADDWDGFVEAVIAASRTKQRAGPQPGFGQTYDWANIARGMSYQ